MQWIKSLRIGKKVKNSENIIKLLDESLSVYGIYCICIRKQSSNLFEIIHSIEIFKKVHKQEELLVVGLADGKKEAFLMIHEIIQEYILEHGNLQNFKENTLKRTV